MPKSRVDSWTCWCCPVELSSSGENKWFRIHCCMIDKINTTRFHISVLLFCLVIPKEYLVLNFLRKSFQLAARPSSYSLPVLPALWFWQRKSCYIRITPGPAPTKFGKYPTFANCTSFFGVQKTNYSRAFNTAWTV